jgi:hypothetical protein
MWIGRRSSGRGPLAVEEIKARDPHAETVQKFGVETGPFHEGRVRLPRNQVPVKVAGYLAFGVPFWLYSQPQFCRAAGQMRMGAQ